MGLKCSVLLKCQFPLTWFIFFPTNLVYRISAISSKMIIDFSIEIEMSFKNLYGNVSSNRMTKEISKENKTERITILDFQTNQKATKINTVIQVCMSYEYKNRHKYQWNKRDFEGNKISDCVFVCRFYGRLFAF